MHDNIKQLAKECGAIPESGFDEVPSDLMLIGENIQKFADSLIRQVLEKRDQHWSNYDIMCNYKER